MKRVLSVLLILCMLASTCVLFASCGKSISEKDVEKDPMAALSQAAENATADFFTLDAKAAAVLEDAFKKGEFNITFESEDLMGGDLTKISETIYVDAKEQNIVSDTLVVYDEEEYTGRIFLDKDGIAASSEALFGIKDTLSLKYADIADKLPKSDLAELLGMAEEDIEELVDMIDKALKESEDKEETKKKMDAILEDVYKALGQTITTEELTGEDDKKFDAVVVTYTLTNDSIEEILNLIVDDLLADYMDVAARKEMQAELDSTIEQLNAAYDVEVILSLFIDKKAGKLAKITVEADMNAAKDSGLEDVTLEGELTFSETEIALNISGKANGEKISVEATIEKTDNDTEVSYEYQVNVGMGSVDVELLSGSFTYEKKSGDLTLEAEISMGDGMDMTSSSGTTKIVVEGNLQVDEKKSVILTVDKVKVGKTTIKVDLTLSAKVIDKVPAKPTSTKDILEMDADELTAIAEYVTALFAPKLEGTYQKESYMGTVTMVFDGVDKVTITTTDVLDFESTSTGTYKLVDEYTLQMSDFDNEDFVEYEKEWDISMIDDDEYITLDGITYTKID